jgi:hypothetical protein
MGLEGVKKGKVAAKPLIFSIVEAWKVWFLVRGAKVKADIRS